MMTLTERMLKRVVSPSLHGLRFRSGWQRVGGRTRHLWILVYHRVGGNRGFGHTVPAGAFSSQMRWIHRWCTPMSALDVSDALDGRRALPRHGVWVTFDDGYLDNWTTAYPILRRYRIPATFFLTTHALETGELLWPDIVRGAILLTRRQRVSWRVNGEATALSLGSVPERQRAADQLIDALRRIRIAGVEEATQRLCAEVDVRHSDIAQRIQMLGWHQVKQMVDGGMTVGAHTHHHYALTQLSEAEVSEELTTCRERLEGQFKGPVETFAYPFGDVSSVSAGIRQAVKRAGFRYAVTTQRGVNDAATDPLLLHRIVPSRQSAYGFIHQLLETR